MKARKPAPTTPPRGKPFTTDDHRRGKGPARGAENAGRPPSAIRQAMRLSLEHRIGMLADIADGKIEGVTIGDRIRAIELLARYALGTTFTATDTEGNNPTPRAAVVVLPAQNI